MLSGGMDLNTDSFIYKIDPQRFKSLPPDWTAVFGKDAPIWVEIGFGNGDFLLYMSKKYPEVNFVGFELSLTSFVKAQKKFYREGLRNIRLVMVDGRFGLRELFRDEEVEKVFINFPCPWSKKGYEDRRITTDDFIKTLACVLKKNGIFELVTDDKKYAYEVYDKLENSGYFTLESMEVNVKRDFTTKYERKWKEQGRDIFSIKARKVKGEKVVRLTWEAVDLHVKIDDLDFDKLNEVNGKVFKGRNDRVFVVKGVFISPSREEVLLKMISSDKGFEQHYIISVEKRKDYWVIKLDSTAHPYRTPAVKWSVYKLAEELSMGDV